MPAIRKLKTPAQRGARTMADGTIEPKYAHCADNLGSRAQRRGAEYRHPRSVSLTESEVRFLRVLGDGAGLSAGIAAAVRKLKEKPLESAQPPQG